MVFMKKNYLNINIVKKFKNTHQIKGTLPPPPYISLCRDDKFTFNQSYCKRILLFYH